jgi:hypothetical protein
MEKQYIVDGKGKHLIISQSSGATVRMLVEMSPEYAKERKKNVEALKEKNKIYHDKNKVNVIIKAKIQQIAIDQLKAEGILNEDGSLNETEGTL